MAIELYTDDEVKIGELDPTSPWRPVKGDYMKFGTQCYEVMSVAFTGGTINVGATDQFNTGDAGVALLRPRCGFCDADSWLPKVMKDILSQ